VGGTGESGEQAGHRLDAEQALRETEARFRLAVKAAGFGVYSHEMRWVYTRAQTFFEGAGAARVAVNHTGVLLDVTERRLAEEALKRADRQKNDFLVVLSHELRNPLAAIRDAGEILARLAGEAPEVRAALATLGRQTGQLTRLVEDLLDISRIVQREISLRQEPLETGQIIDQTAETVQPLVREKSHRLGITKPFAPIHVRGDRARLVQCVGNILHNAAKYTDLGGEIEVRVLEAGAEVAVEVRDNGGGIAPRILPHVSDLFVQSDRALDRSHGGLGIGLSVVEHLIERHGGSVSAASEGAGRGSTFTIRLPRLEPEPQVSAPCAARDEARARRLRTRRGSRALARGPGESPLGTGARSAAASAASGGLRGAAPKSMSNFAVRASASRARTPRPAARRRVKPRIAAPAAASSRRARPHRSRERPRGVRHAAHLTPRRFRCGRAVESGA